MGRDQTHPVPSTNLVTCTYGLTSTGSYPVIQGLIRWLLGSLERNPYELCTTKHNLKILVGGSSSAVCFYTPFPARLTFAAVRRASSLDRATFGTRFALRGLQVPFASLSHLLVQMQITRA